jgi:hypothetical protein
MPGSDSRTSITLLGRLRQAPAEQAAWSEFVERYGRKIYGWCRRPARVQSPVEAPHPRLS